MITHQEALELVKILYFNINEKTNQELNRTSKIYDKLDNYITQQEKQEKLLELYKKLANENLQINLSVLEKIKELENENE